MKVMFVVPSNFQYLQALRSERGKNLFLPLAILQPPAGTAFRCLTCNQHSHPAPHTAPSDAGRALNISLKLTAHWKLEAARVATVRLLSLP